jgi:hypothetical protein
LTLNINVGSIAKANLYAGYWTIEYNQSENLFGESPETLAEVVERMDELEFGFEIELADRNAEGCEDGDEDEDEVMID